jgi:hypothetical protein
LTAIIIVTLQFNVSSRFHSDMDKISVLF